MGWMDELKIGRRAEGRIDPARSAPGGRPHGRPDSHPGRLLRDRANRGLATPVPNHGPIVGPVGPAAGANAASSTLHVSEITAAHLFGETHSTVDDANAPQTSVQLVLAGVLAVPDPKRGLAILGPNAGTAKL